MSRPIVTALCVVAGLAFLSTGARSEPPRMMVCDNFTATSNGGMAQKYAEFGNAQLAAGKSSFFVDADSAIVCAW